MADVIREFLVSLGFKVDESGLRKFKEGVGSATKVSKELGVTAVEAAGAVTAAITAIAQQYEDLYFTSLRTQTTVSTFRTFEYGSRAIGISAEQAASSLEQLNLQMKLNPGREALANMLGVKTVGREVKAVYTDLIGVFARMTREGGPMGFAVASQYANQFGISPSELLRRIQLRDQEAAAEARYADKLRESGLNMDELARKSHDYNQQLRDLGSSIGLVWDQTANKWLPSMTNTVKFLTDWADFAVRAGKNTDGLSSSVLALVSALGGLKLAAAFLARLGITGAVGGAAAVGGTAAAGLLAAAGLAYALYPQDAGESDEKERARRQADMAGGYPNQAAKAAAEGRPAAGGTANDIIGYFMSQGWSREAAAGIAANLHAESGFKHNIPGDGGRAYGVAQWHPDRQENFRRWAGKDIRSSTLQEQLAFVHYELTQGGEQAAGRALRGASSAGGAGAIVSKLYERPAAVEEAAFNRARLAKSMFDASLVPSPADAAGAGANISQTNNITVNGATDPGRTAEMTGREVRNANSDLVRNAGTNVR